MLCPHVIYRWDGSCYRLCAVRQYDVARQVEKIINVKSIRSQSLLNRRFVHSAYRSPFITLEHPTGTCTFAADGCSCMPRPSYDLQWHYEEPESGPRMAVFKCSSDLFSFRATPTGACEFSCATSLHSYTVSVPEYIDKEAVPALCKGRVYALCKQISNCRIVVEKEGGLVSYSLNSFRRVCK